MVKFTLALMVLSNAPKRAKFEYCCEKSSRKEMSRDSRDSHDSHDSHALLRLSSGESEQLGCFACAHG